MFGSHIKLLLEEGLKLLAKVQTTDELLLDLIIVKLIKLKITEVRGRYRVAIYSFVATRAPACKRAREMEVSYTSGGTVLYSSPFTSFVRCPLCFALYRQMVMLEDRERRLREST
jgi:hypothetical protein